MSQVKRHYVRLGEQINHLVHALALANKWSMTRAMNEVAVRTGYAESTVYRWRQGRLRPRNKILEILIGIGKEDAGLPRTWGKDLLTAASYPKAEITRLVNETWGAKEVRSIPCNLPPPEHTAFIGRRREMARLLQVLSPDHAAPIISVDGIGGVGKTALVLEAAYRCLRKSTGETSDPHVPTFAAIIFASAKQCRLTPLGILARHQAQCTLRDIFREIAHTLDRPDIARATPDEQRTRVYDALAQQRTLLIVDNLETVVEPREVLDFLFDLPRQVKAVITTRERVALIPICLAQLPKEDGMQLIQHEAQERGVLLENDQAMTLHERTGGVPAAIVYAIGQIAACHSVERVLEQVDQASGDVARFCFESSVAPLREQPAHRLLMAIAMFPKRPLRKAVVYVAGIATDPIVADEGLARLQRLSLIGQRDGRSSMLPLTREYALVELVAHPNFEQSARERWVEWYLDFAREYGGRDWEEFQIQYDRLEEEWENLLAVFDWCAGEDRYVDMVEFWQKKGVNDFANIYGYWSDRVVWLDWLTQAAERRGDWPIVVKAMSDKAWVLAMMGQHLEKADALLKRAWSLCTHVGPDRRYLVAHNTGVLRIRQKAYSEAPHWFDLSKTSLKEAPISERERVRELIAVRYWLAAIHYEKKEYAVAEKRFRRVLELARTIGWQRAIVYAQNWLADIAIAQGNLEQAEGLLQVGLPVASRNKDRRRIAFYKRSFARLEQARGNLTEAQRLAREAIDGFERLGMRPEAEEMQDLTNTSQSSRQTEAT